MFDENDINNPLETLKVEQALRSETMKLEYRKKNKPSEVNILDYTVIEALNRQMPKDYLFDELGLERCPTCKNYPAADDKFCSNCGQRLEG